MNLLSILLQAPAGGSQWSGILMMVVIVAIFYFFMIRPQQKKQKERRYLYANRGSGWSTYPCR